MSDRLVQQHPRPARTKYHFHFPSRRLARIKLQYGLPRCFGGKVLGSLFPEKEVQRHAPAATTAAAPGHAVSLCNT